MKTLIISLLLTLTVLASGADYSKSVIVTGGALSETNSVYEQFEICSVGFTLPVNGTNTFAISFVRPFFTAATVTTAITTNTLITAGDLAGNVTTNYQYTGPTQTLYTNTLFSVTTTNDTSFQIYDSRTTTPMLPDSFVLQEDDIINYSWSFTNTIPFIRNAKMKR